MEWAAAAKLQAVHIKLPAASERGPGPEVKVFSASVDYTLQMQVQLGAVTGSSAGWQHYTKNGEMRLDRVQHLSHSWRGG